MTERTNQVAPGSLEIVRTFLNTWLIPNDTREPTDLLDSRVAMERFYSIWFVHDDGSQDVTINPEQVWRLRADLRALLGKGDLQTLSEWLTTYPVEVQVTRDEEGVSRIAYRSGKT